MPLKSEKQWCKDNGVPESARYNNSYNVQDVIKKINSMLAVHGLRVRTKHRRGYGTGSFIWVEKDHGKKEGRA